MYLAYFDESGDSGLVNSPTQFFVLACLLIHEQHWLSSLDQLIAMRRGVKLRHGISTRPEIKSTDIRRGQGPLQDLRWSPSQRRQFFDELVLSASGRLRNTHVFSVAIDKQPCAAKGRDPRSTAWEFAIQRLDRFSRAMQEHVSVFPDEGHAVLIKRLMRRMRRYHAVPKRWGRGTFAIPTERVIEDPNDRQSHDSYFVQVADWAAYAAHRSVYVHPNPGVNPALWDLFGQRRLLEVNRVNGGPPGLVVWP